MLQETVETSERTVEAPESTTFYSTKSEEVRRTLGEDFKHDSVKYEKTLTKSIPLIADVILR